MQGLRTNSPKLRRLTYTATAAVLTMCAALPGTTDAKLSHGKAQQPKAHRPKPKPTPAPPAALYAETNNGTANQLLVFRRATNGTLSLRQTVATGGKGGLQAEPGCAPPGGCPLLDASDEVAITKDAKLLFAVNAGSNTISSFSLSKSGAKLVEAVGSGGQFPNSLTIHGDELYVLNNNSANIAGFKFTSRGQLTAIPRSIQALTTEHAPFSRQIGFDNTGKLLVVSHLTDASFDTFPVTHGVAGPAVNHPSASAEPFSFAFDPYNHLIDTEIVNDMDLTQSSNASSYALSSTGALTAINTVPTRGYGACWTQISADGKQVYQVNTGGPSPFGTTVSSFALSPSGKLTFESVTPSDGEFTLTDEWLSPGSRYLYVVSPLIDNPASMPTSNGSRIVTFSVGAHGKLTRLGQTSAMLAPGLTGLVGS
jgi:hypothetical protein